MPTKKDILLVISTLTLLFVMIEIGFRISGYRRSIYEIDSKTGLTILSPNSKFYWKKECFKNLVKVNSYGFHDREFSIPKPPNTYRIAVLGDSYVESLQIEFEKTFHKLLEKKLNEYKLLTKTVEIYSFGHSGNGTLLNLEYLKEYAEKFQPDLVIDCFLVGNDFRDDSCKLAKTYVDQTGDKVVYTKPCATLNPDNTIKLQFNHENMPTLREKYIVRFASKFSFLVWLHEKFQILRYKFKERSLNIANIESLSAQVPKLFDISKVPVDIQVFLRQYSAEWEEAWLIEEYLLKEMNDYCRKKGMKFMVVSLTEGFRVHKELQDTGLFEWKKPERLLNELSTRLGFPYLPLIDIFKNRYSQTSHMTTFECDGHWNEVGHQWAADAIFEYLMNHKDLLVN